mmetsp:Transcript_9151/g.16801  ORF Transcript_9151/g.16801 Transcript_9151/m.16801 type:complete len:220 (+) Transcript_9151:56-715(+)
MGVLAQLLRLGHEPGIHGATSCLEDKDASSAEVPPEVMDPHLRPKLEAFYRHTLDQIHSDMQQLKAYAGSGVATSTNSDLGSFLQVKSAALDPRMGFLPSLRPATSHLFYSGGDKKDAQMDNFLKEDAGESETEAADLFEDAVMREKHAAKMTAKGENDTAQRDYAQMVEEEEKMEKLMDRAAEDAEEDAMLVLQQDKYGKDIDAQPYADDLPEEDQLH